MKVRDKKDLQIKSKNELEKLLKEAYDALFSLKLEHEQKLLKNTRALALKRKEIAVISSILENNKEGGK